MQTLVVVWVLFSTHTGLPVSSPNTFTTSSGCNQAAATYMRLTKSNEAFRCEEFHDVLDTPSLRR